MRASTAFPPLQSLRAFEAVARLLSFRRAGEELLISQSAISHHIRTLETHLGVQLFVRKSRSISLTSPGERYFASVREAFGVIADATSDLAGAKARQQVRVSLPPSFAANWLVPRLAQFAKAHPDVELLLEPDLRLADLNAGDADVSIRFGSGNWPGVESRLLMAERLAPALSPTLLGRGPSPQRPEDILAHPLLTVLKPYEWDIWAAAQGLDLQEARTIQLTDYNIALQAAVDGHGVVMARLGLAGDRITSGALVLPFPDAVISPGLGHWMVTAIGGPRSPAARVFMDWIGEQAAAHLRQADEPPAE